MRNLILKAAIWAQAQDRERQEGQGVVEYALVIGGVSVVLIAVLATAGQGWIGSVTGKVNTALGIS